MRKLRLSGCLVACVMATLAMAAQEPAWNAAAIKECDRPRLPAPPGMLQNLVTMETFSVRGGQIHHVEAAPFVTIPYGLGNRWTPGSGR